MIKTPVVTAALFAIAAAMPAAITAGGTVPARAQAPRQVAPADAAPFVGDWTLAMEGPSGPARFDLSVKIEKEKVIGEIASEKMPKQAITDISGGKDGLTLGYTFMYEGNPVETVVSLTPSKDGKIAAQIDFAGGAYVMTGTAAKKEPAK